MLQWYLWPKLLLLLCCRSDVSDRKHRYEKSHSTVPSERINVKNAIVQSPSAAAASCIATLQGCRQGSCQTSAMTVDKMQRIHA